jgi:excinuclease ABC subunit C
MRRDALQQQAQALPATPGVYLFADAKGRVLYVGKADVLRDRVRSYFGPSLDIRHVRMLERAQRIDHVATDSIAEAYLLEANLIKRHGPRYNIRLKDDKSYPYVKVTLGEPFPRVLRTRKLGDRTARYFGPYANAKSVDDTLDLLQKLFPYRTCKLTIVADADGRGRTQPPSALPGGRPCLLYHIRRCTAPCVGAVDTGDYRRTIDQIVLFLEGRQETLARQLRSEMTQASERLDYERAAAMRDRLHAVERTLERQEVHAYAGGDFDVLGVALEAPEACVQLFVVRDGKITGREHFFLEGAEDVPRPEVLASFLRQRYALATDVPPEIVVGEEVPEAAGFEEFATQRRGSRVVLRVARRGRKRRLAELAERNAAEALGQERVRWLADRGKTQAALSELQGALRLESVPKRIECYDVSHVQGTDVVASLVVFEDGRPRKDSYRRFRIKGGDRNDDFANMRQVLLRRFRHSAAANGGSPSIPLRPPADASRPTTPDGAAAWPLPDLVIVDGGKGQLGAASQALSEAGRLNVPVAALAKEREELFLPGRSDAVALPRGSQGLYLIQRIRDEAHRFAVMYHRSLRGRRQVRSLLDDIAGVGPRRKRALLGRFGSVRAIRDAAVEEIASAAGVSAALAERIKQELSS